MTDIDYDAILDRHGFAPAGKKRLLPVGLMLQLDHVLERQTKEVTLGPGPGMTKTIMGWKVVETEPWNGVVVGWRYPYTGIYRSHGVDEQAERKSLRSHKALLVAFPEKPRKKPVYVLQQR